jgi:hypothetical protein
VSHTAHAPREVRSILDFWNYLNSDADLAVSVIRKLEAKLKSPNGASNFRKTFRSYEGGSEINWLGNLDGDQLKPKTVLRQIFKRSHVNTLGVGFGVVNIGHPQLLGEACHLFL